MNRMVSSKKLFRGAFEEAELPRLPAAPFILSHSARLEQVPLREMYSDPTRYVRCLQNARRLYGYDAIIGGGDASLEAEIAGCGVAWGGDYDIPRAVPQPGYDVARLDDIDVTGAGHGGRFGAVIESLRRIDTVAGPTSAMGAAVTGPLQLAATLTGRDIVKELIENPGEAGSVVEASAAFLLKIIQVYCQIELDVIFVTDNLFASLPAARVSWLRSVLGPIVNTIHFYNAYAVLVPMESFPESAARMVEAGADGVVACTNLTGWSEMTGARPGAFGLAVPSRLMAGGQEEMREYVQGHLPKCPVAGVFLATDGEVAPQTPPDNLHFLMNSLKG